MNLLSVIDKIYENKSFTTIFIIAIILLALLFLVVLLLGLKDAKKAKEPKKKDKEEDVKDVTFKKEIEADPISEDVTFELPVLTKNLESFKKNLEEEIKKENEVDIKPTVDAKLNKSNKPIKILDINEIEDTAIVPIVEEKKNKKTKKKEEKKETKKEEPIEELLDEPNTYNDKDSF